jgi:hypothetical protein
MHSLLETRPRCVSQLARPPHHQYLLFCQDKRQELKSTLEVGANLTIALGEAWKKLSAEERAVYEQAANEHFGTWRTSVDDYRKGKGMPRA